VPGVIDCPQRCNKSWNSLSLLFQHRVIPLWVMLSWKKSWHRGMFLLRC
jgi:hypothetical protein